MDSVYHRRFRLAKTFTFPIMISAGMLGLMAGGEGVRDLLAYNRQAILSGEIWRLLSGNFAHLDRSHALLNCLVLVLLPMICPVRWSLGQWLTATLLISIGVALALFFFIPKLSLYVGFSGTLHGLYVMAAVQCSLKGDRLSFVLLLLIVGKLIWEHYHGALPLDAVVSAPVITEAHLSGALTSILLLIFIYIKQYVKQQT